MAPLNERQRTRVLHALGSLGAAVNDLAELLSAEVETENESLSGNAIILTADALDELFLVFPPAEHGDTHAAAAAVRALMGDR